MRITSESSFGDDALQHRVKRKQQNSRMCLVCGMKNVHGLKGSFYELENNELVYIFTPTEAHQSYPGRMHGGITTAVLDETIGRAIMTRYEEMLWGVTVEFTTRFKKPVPLNQELRVVGRITNENSRFFEGTGELLLPDGEVAASGSGKYLKMPIGKITDFDADEEEWKVVHGEHDPTSVEL